MSASRNSELHLELGVPKAYAVFGGTDSILGVPIRWCTREDEFNGYVSSEQLQGIAIPCAVMYEIPNPCVNRSMEKSPWIFG